MLRMLNRYRDELASRRRRQELDEARPADRAAICRRRPPSVADRARRDPRRQTDVDVAVRNLTGHKLPTGYPSRRAWLHVTVRDRAGAAGLRVRRRWPPTDRSQGNDNDIDPARFEPHYAEIRERRQVQIYESMMGDPAGAPTTGLLTGVRYLKDNRLLPRGFEKASADRDIAVVGDAAQDADFAGVDRSRALLRRCGRHRGPVARRRRIALPVDRLSVGGQPEKWTTPPSPGGSSPTTTRWPRFRRKSWPALGGRD